MKKENRFENWSNWVLENDGNKRLFIDDNENQETFMFIYCYKKNKYYINLCVEDIKEPKRKKIKEYLNFIKCASNL